MRQGECWHCHQLRPIRAWDVCMRCYQFLRAHQGFAAMYARLLEDYWKEEKSA